MIPPKTRPIIMSAPMVRTLLAGKKTQTRRIIKPDQPSDDGTWPTGRDPVDDCRYGKPGDLLWCKETFLYRGAQKFIIRKADISDSESAEIRAKYGGWKPSIFMPRHVSRLTLELKKVRVERLQEISEPDAIAEGYEPGGDASARIWYSVLWDTINGSGSWAKNPWVWALTFNVHRCNVDELLKQRGE